MDREEQVCVQNLFPSDASLQRLNEEFRLALRIAAFESAERAMFSVRLFVSQLELVEDSH